MDQNAGDFRVSKEILAVIPSDPYEQLDLARKITSMAIASRVSRLETETARLRDCAGEKDKLIDELRGRLAQLDKLLQETDSRLRTSLEDNIKLSKERDSLVLSTKKLNRELSKLEAFKRHLMQSLKEEDSPATKSETVDIVTYDQVISKSSDESGVKKYPMVPYMSPKLTPKATPRFVSTAVSPKITSSATSPVKTRGETQVPFSPWYPSSQLSSANNSPPRGRSLNGRPGRIDGKEFFRLTRSRLSYEQFAAFLANIKELNSHRQTREETLKKAEEIFGGDNVDLFVSFQGLLNRNAP